MSTISIVDSRIYYIGEKDLSPFHKDTGYYVDVIFSDEGIDTYGPYETESECKSLGVC